MRRRLPAVVAVAALLIGGAVTSACGGGGGDVPTSVYLEVYKAAGVAAPAEVKLDVYTAGGIDAAMGALVRSRVAAVGQPRGDLLGTVVIYAAADATALIIGAEGRLDDHVTLNGRVEVALRSRRQVSARLTLGPPPGSPDGGALADAGGDASADRDDRDSAGGGGGGGAGGGGGSGLGIGGGPAHDAGADAAGGRPAPPSIISVDFIGSGVAMAAGETAGVVPAANWNSAATGTGTLAALLSSTGAPTSAAIGWNAGGPGNTFTIGLTDIPGDYRMMNGYLDPVDGQVATVTVSGLPPPLAGGRYDVYLYVNGSVAGSETRTYNYSMNGMATLVSQSGAQVFDGGFVMVPPAGGSGNYVVFRGVSGSSFTITAIPGSSTGTPARRRAPVNGLQIVPVE